MLRTNLIRLSCLLALAGCAAETGAGGSGECRSSLPGDADCAPTGGDGKSDAWDSANDPVRLSQSLSYRISELPMSGRAGQTTWAASYWPTLQGSTNYRWQGESTLSPLEKYDSAFNDWTPAAGEFTSSVPEDCGPDAPERYGAYRDWLGPAARWQSGAQGRDVMYNGRDDDDDMKVDECDFDDHDGIQSWWGLCHAWAPAAILEPEPLHAVEMNGQRFEVSDIKALILTVYDGTDSLFLGGRCNAREFEHDDNHRITMDECRDVNAGAWHVVVSNFLGLNQRAFVEDRTAGFEVWNQPVVGYNVTQLNEVTAEQALSILGVMGDRYPFNDEAKHFYEVQMTTDYLVEGHQSTEPLGEEGYIRHDNYHYILEVDADGKIIGGEWAGSSRDSHPDFLWVPLRARAGRANPNVDFETVRNLIRLSREEGGGGGGGGGPVEGRTFTNEERTDIPDNDPNGARSVVAVPEAFDVETISVNVDIDHTYRGDLEVVLEHEGRRVTLANQEGGSADDLVETYTVDDFSGASSEGEWALHVIDHAGEDTGAIQKFALTFVNAN